MIRLGRLFPKHLNLNGDFGNLEVLSRQLGWRGLESEIVDICVADDIVDDLDFILVGHGSEAAWQDILNDFRQLEAKLLTLKAKGVVILAVSTGFEHSVEIGLIEGISVEAIEQRVSKFVIYPDGKSEVLGYVNVNNNLPPIHRCGSVIGTTLHGPVLAKNPGLLVEVLQTITARKNLPLPEIIEAKKADQLADLIAELWELERELASE